jgi:hypothetical protein
VEDESEGGIGLELLGVLVLADLLQRMFNVFNDNLHNL